MAVSGFNTPATFALVLLALAGVAVGLLLLFRQRLRRVKRVAESVQAELRASEARYRLLAENASDVIWSIRIPDLSFTYISPSIRRLRGLSVEQAMRENFLDSIVEDQRDRVARLIETRLRRFREGHFDASEAQRVEVRQACQDGREITVEIIASLIVDDTGEVTGIQGISRDITARKRAETARLVRESILDALARGASIVFNSDDKDAALCEALSRLGEAVGADRVYIFENHPEPDSGRPLASMRYEWVRQGIEAQIDNPEMLDMPYAEAIPNWLEPLANGEVVHGLVRTMATAERDLLKAQQIRSIAVVPIFMDGGFWGMIGFDDCSRERHWVQAEIDALKIAAATLGAAIRGIRSEQQLQHLVSTDSLTGLCSRRTFLEQARQAHREAMVKGHRVGLLIIDLDHFKRINDSHGHPIGDEALKAFARVCRQALRESDLIGRMGGEEFAVLLDPIEPAHAADVAEKLRERVSSTPIRLKKTELKLTISIGLALSQPDEAQFAELLKRADQALYWAKHGGRDRVERA